MFCLTVFHTTPKPRPGEINGVNYFFVSPSQFSSLLEQGGFVEHPCFGGKYYGTTNKLLMSRLAKD
jgi:guanylate kinase